MELAFLKDLVIIFAVALVVVAVLHRVRIPSIAGYIVAGILVGPSSLELVDDPQQVETLAEVGVVLLLFSIGLELSLDKMRKLWRAIVLGGSLQVLATIAAVAVLASAFALPLRSAIFLGFVIAVSSTAIVLRGLSAHGGLNTPHGRLTLGILVFQDLAVVPMMLVIPLLSATGTPVDALFRSLGEALLVLAGTLVGARLLVPRILSLVARTRQRDLFVLSVLLVCMGTAWIVSLAGVPLALGAFLAGLIVAGSEFRHQALSDVIPLREVLASVFFVSVGMLLDLAGAFAQFLPILGILLAILAGKFLIVALTAIVLRLPLRVAILSGASLAQVGEFSFILFKSAKGASLLAEPLAGNLLVAIILSMLVTPFILVMAPRIASGAGRVGWLVHMLQVKLPEEIGGESELRDHVIIAGYGLTGRQVLRALEASGTPNVVVDMNPDSVREVLAQGGLACLGDVTSAEVLEKLGLDRARELVLAINDPDATARAVHIAHQAAPGLRIIARTLYASEVDELLNAGASDVVAAEAEAAVEITARLLRGREVDEPLQARLLDRIREEQASLEG